MQAVATAGLLSLTQTAETPGVGAVILRQNGNTAAEAQTQTVESPFTRLLLQSLTQKAGKEAGRKTQEVSDSDEENTGEKTDEAQADLLPGLCAIGVFLPMQEAPAAVETTGENTGENMSENSDQALIPVGLETDAAKPSDETALPELQALAVTEEATPAAAGREAEAGVAAGLKKDNTGTQQTKGTNKTNGTDEANGTKTGASGATFQDLVAEKTVHALSSMTGKGESDQSASAGSDGFQEKKINALQPERQEQLSTSFPIQTPEEKPGAEAAEKAEAVQKALDRFVQDYRGAETDGKELRIVLEPEHYGELSISVSRGEHGLMAKIRSGDREVCAAISDQLQKLVSALENKGIQVRDVDVVYSGMSQSADLTQSGAGGQRQFQSQSQNQASRSGKAEAAAAQGAEASPAEPIGDGLSGIVEYRV